MTKMRFSTKITLALVLVCHLVCLGATQGESNEGVTRKYINGGEDVILPCSSGNSQPLEKTVVHWKNKDNKEVFFYEDGQHSENGRCCQDEQYSGRVSLFYNELKNGNASMILRDARIEDTGNYTCILPRVTPRGQRSTIELIVEPVYKNRFGLERGAVHRPVLGISNVTDAGVELQCVVTGSSSEPSVEWATCEGTALNATGQTVRDPRGRYDTTRLVTVTETATNCFRCVVKQKDIYHMIDNEIIVPLKLFEKKSCQGTGRDCDSGRGCDSGVLAGLWFSGAVTVALPVALYLILKKRFIARRKKQCQNNMNVDDLETGKTNEQLVEKQEMSIIRDNTSGHNIENVSTDTKIINKNNELDIDLKSSNKALVYGEEKIPLTDSDEENVVQKEK